MKRSYRIRYHLAKGPNFMKWQIRNKDLGIEDYFDPASFVYTCKNGKLNNSSRTAQRIHDGDNKTVCSWISYSEFGSVNQTLESFGVMSRISYNPRLKPHWTSWDFEDANIDGFEGDVYIINKSLYVRTEELKRFLSNAVELKTA
jgi:hypothetical protein